MLLWSLGPEQSSDELFGARMAPFFCLTHTIFVAERGLEHFELLLRPYGIARRRFEFRAVPAERAVLAAVHGPRRLRDARDLEHHDAVTRHTHSRVRAVERAAILPGPQIAYRGSACG